MILFLSSSKIFGNALKIISGILVARWLLPEELGFFNSFTIVVGYIILVQAGIPSGLSRELPFYIGTGNKEKAENFAAVSQFWMLWVSFTVLIISFIVSIVLLLQQKYQYAAGTFVIGILSWQGLYVTKYLKVLYRTNRDFNYLSKIGIIESISSFVTIIFVWFYGFYGLCLRAVLTVLIDFYFTWRWKPLSVKPKFNKSLFKELIKVGTPMYIVANVYSLWPVIQKTVIVSLGGTKALGLFAIAIITENSMKTISASLSSVTYPAMSTGWGQGYTINELLKKFVLKPFILFSGIFLLSIPIWWYLLPLVIEKFLPNYTAGIEAAQWMLLAGFMGFLNVFSNMYNVMKKQKERFISYLSAIISWLLAVSLLYTFNGFSLVIFPQAMVCGMAIMTGVNFYFLIKYKNYKNPIA